MIKIKISDDFTITPGARTRKDGKFSGEEFYQNLLKARYDKALKENKKLEIDLDGTHGYASSFLSEAFGLLSKEYGGKKVLDNLIIISNEVPKYKEKIIEYIINEKQ